MATLRSCYLPGATEDHGGLFDGPAQEYVDSITTALTHPRARMSHNLTNLLIELDGDVATAESYCVTFARIKADGDYHHSFTGARMIDRLERRDGDPRTWGIAHRQLIWDWNHDAPEAETWMRGLLAPDLSVLRLSGKFPAEPRLHPPPTPSTPPARPRLRSPLTPEHAPGPRIRRECPIHVVLAA